MQIENITLEICSKCVAVIIFTLAAWLDHLEFQFCNIHAAFLCCFFFSEISLPNEQSRADILKIHAAPIAKHGEIGELM